MAETTSAKTEFHQLDMLSTELLFEMRFDLLADTPLNVFFCS